MTTLLNITKKYNLSQEEQFEILKGFRLEIGDEPQYKKALKAKKSEKICAIEAFAKVYKKFPRNLLPILGIFDTLIDLNDYDRAILFYNKYAPTFDNKYLVLFDEFIMKLNELKSKYQPNPFLNYYGKYEGVLKSENVNGNATLSISDAEADAFIVVNDKYYIECMITKEGVINSKEIEIDEDDYEGSDSIKASGLINNSFEINLNFQYFYSIDLTTQDFKFTGKKIVDYFKDAVQNTFEI